MKTPRSSLTLILTLILVSCALSQEDALHTGMEAHLKNIRQITFGGENAEAYLSFSTDHLVFQSSRDSFRCDQIFTMDLKGGDLRLVSTGTGRTTCAYYLPGDTTIIFASTHGAADSCPPTPDYSMGYVWPVYDAFDIYVVNARGGEPRLLSGSGGYDAEATVSPKGDRIVFTSTRDGDLELYSMNIDGSDVRRLTHETGYDGGAFYSADGSKIIYRAHHPTDSASVADYKNLLAKGLIRPSVMELFIMNADGSDKRQITEFGVASFAPYFHPDGDRVIFCSNLKDPKGRNFDLFMINVDGTGLEQITFNETFDGFPVFTPDGKHLVFASNRNAKVRGETNVFIADWVP